MKIPIKTADIMTYLYSDLSFVSNLLKQKFMEESIVKTYLDKPCSRVIKDMETPTQKLMENFSEASLKNNN